MLKPRRKRPRREGEGRGGGHLVWWFFRMTWTMALTLGIFLPLYPKGILMMTETTTTHINSQQGQQLVQESLIWIDTTGSSSSSRNNHTPSPSQRSNTTTKNPATSSTPTTTMNNHKHTYANHSDKNISSSKNDQTTEDMTRRQVIQSLLYKSSTSSSSSTTMDFSGGGYTQFAYRLGDVFDLWYLSQYNMTLVELEYFYARLFPNTLAHRYLQRVIVPTINHGGGISSDDTLMSSMQYAHRNLTILLQVLEDYDKERTVNQVSRNSTASSSLPINSLNRPGPHDLVVHLRLGDVLTSDCCIDTVNPPSIHDQWWSLTEEDGFVNYDGNIKHNYNRAEYEILLNRIPSIVKFDKCVIVGAAHFLTNAQHQDRNYQYRNLVADYLHDKLNCTIEYYHNPHPDETFVYMAAAHWLVVAMGGFAQMAAACVRVRHGQGNHSQSSAALFDKFNGEIASWHADWFNDYQKQVYRDTYIDWSRYS
jgi:hypothetical protein